MLPNPTARQRQKRQRLAALAAVEPGPARKAQVAVTDLTAVAVREPSGRRTYLLLSIKTDAGITGIGEMVAGPDPQAAVAGALQNRKHLVGADALAAEALLHRLSRSLGDGQARFLAAIHMALLDVLGKLCKAPAAEVLGGPTRSKARVLARLDDVPGEKLQQVLQQAYQAGYRAFIVPLPGGDGGRAPTFARQTLNYLEKLRPALGPDADLVLNCRGQLTPAEAARLSKAVERFHLLFLDEPVRQPSAGVLRKISAETVVPLGMGRQETSLDGLQELLRSQAIDVPRPNYSNLSISAVRRLAALAETHYLALAPLHEAGPVSTAAALQVAASLPNFFIQEVPVPADERDRQMRRELVIPTVESPAGGFLPLPAGPGLGVTLHEDAVRKYQVR